VRVLEEGKEAFLPADGSHGVRIIQRKVSSRELSTSGEGQLLASHSRGLPVTRGVVSEWSVERALPAAAPGRVVGWLGATACHCQEVMEPWRCNPPWSLPQAVSMNPSHAISIPRYWGIDQWCCKSTIHQQCSLLVCIYNRMEQIEWQSKLQHKNGSKHNKFLKPFLPNVFHHRLVSTEVIYESP
jgi:hypothetical protein